MPVRPVIRIAALVAALTTLPTAAQYTPPGSLAQPRVPAVERVEQGAEAAPWRLGPVRLEPRAWLRDVGWVDNVFAAPDDAPQESDLTATLGAGVVGYLRLGPKLLAAAFLLPEHVWWQDLSELESENMSFGAGVFGALNRLQLEAELRRDERQRLLSSELTVPVDVRQERAALRFDIDLRGPLSVFAAAAADELRHFGRAAAAIPGGRLDVLDRDEERAGVGVAYRRASAWRVGLGIEATDTRFPIDPAGRSSSGLGPLAEVTFTGDRLDADLVASYREIDFEAGEAGDRNELTGIGRVGWKASRRLRLDLYGERALIYSALSSDAFFLQDRIGLSVGSPWSRRLRARVFLETGSDDYAEVEAGLGVRRDDVTGLGGDLGLDLGRRLTLRAGMTRVEYDSNLPGFDRRVTVLRFGLEAGGEPDPW